jgi:hypothetical protein
MNNHPFKVSIPANLVMHDPKQAALNNFDLTIPAELSIEAALADPDLCCPPIIACAPVTV